MSVFQKFLGRIILVRVGLWIALTHAGLAHGTVYCDGLKDAHLSSEQRWSQDNISVTEELANFWSIHQRFGFVKDGNRMLLVAKNQDLSTQILNELGFGRHRTPVTFEKVEGGVKTDVTALIPSLVKDIHGEPLKHDGPNCWNFCLRSIVTEGTLPMSAAEFNHWMDSPLAVEVKGSEPMQRGDVLVFRNPKLTAFKESQEVHGAMYWSQNVVIAKSAMGRYFPHRILDLREAISFYYPNRAEEIRVYRLQSLEQASAKIQSETGAALRSLVKQALQIERESIPMFTGRKFDGQPLSLQERLVLEDAYESFAKLLKTEISRNVNGLNRELPSYELEKAIWQGLHYKSLTYEKISLFD